MNLYQTRLFRSFFPMVSFVWLGLFAAGAQSAAELKAEAEASEPRKVVESLTTTLLDLARVGQDKLKNEPEEFYAEIERVLDPMVSFKFIAKNVMGQSYWKQATEVQREQFIVVFKRSLVETYVKGMSQNLDYEMAVLDKESKVLKSKASIVQKITGPDSVNHVVYTLGLGKSGQWKVTNLTLDGVNLGKTFRSQFAQGMKENKNDIDATIAGWAGKS
ncbi:phospholipid transport system substrate-binding protein [Alteromonadaceae bacterium Bs31]|nr:phospholipid transport system substrate-binding protein [Alteromonadaceae bacterium Bs31]